MNAEFTWNLIYDCTPSIHRMIRIAHETKRFNSKLPSANTGFSLLYYIFTLIFNCCYCYLLVCCFVCAAPIVVVVVDAGVFYFLLQFSIYDFGWICKAWMNTYLLSQLSYNRFVNTIRLCIHVYICLAYGYYIASTVYWSHTSKTDVKFHFSLCFRLHSVGRSFEFVYHHPILFYSSMFADFKCDANL